MMNYLRTTLLTALGGVIMLGCSSSHTKEGTFAVIPTTVAESSDYGWHVVSSDVILEGKHVLAEAYINNKSRDMKRSVSATALIARKIAEHDTMTIYGHFEDMHGGRALRVTGLDLYDYHFSFDK
ncbi:MAG: hypothetical protein V1725_06775 [archaeon]